jgi:predicted deacylase
MTEPDRICERRLYVSAARHATRSAALLTILLARVSIAQQPVWGPFRISTTEARPGEKASGFIAIAARNDTATQIPITIIRGRQAGPTLALVGGTHGSEVAPIIALQRVRAVVDAEQLRGTLVIVHVANMPSFLGRTIYYSPIDGKNLNRVYPGRADGTVSERIAHAITTQIIDRSDFLVDMHAGDGNESLRPYTYWNKLGLNPRVDSIAREMALAWGHDRIIIDTARPRDPAASVYTQNTAHLRNKPSLTTEAGSLGEPNEAMVQRNVNGALRLLRYLRMLPGTVEMVTHPIWIERTEVLRSPASGTWHAAVERGHTVAPGTLLGTVTDFFGNTVAEIRAPFAGEVLYIIGTPAMNKGEPIGMIGSPRP